MLGLSAVFGGLAMFAFSNRVSLYINNPQAKPIVANITRENENKKIIEGTLEDSKKTLRCIPCYSEENPLRATKLRDELVQYNNWNQAALNRVNARIQTYNEAPAMISYKDSIRRLDDLGMYALFAGLGVAFIGIGLDEFGKHKARRKYERGSATRTRVDPFAREI